MGANNKKISKSQVFGGVILNIFVTIGTKNYQFNRLVSMMDKKGVIIQYGVSNKPLKAKGFDFLKKQEMIDLINWSDLIICHAGTGTVMEAIDSGKKMILFPRQKKFKEHVDDHQINFANYIEKRFGIKVIYDEKELWSAIKKSSKPKNIQKNNLLINEIKRIVFE